MRVRCLLLATVLLLGTTVPVQAHDTDPLEQLVIKMATTAEDHRALASYYRSKAESAREGAERHRSIAGAYRGGKFRNRERMRAHCDSIVSNQEVLAKEYEELATLHEEEAKNDE